MLRLGSSKDASATSWLDVATALKQIAALKKYLVNLNGSEEGPYSDAQIAQMFADHREQVYAMQTGAGRRLADRR